jgi:hypothetical protein
MRFSGMPVWFLILCIIGIAGCVSPDSPIPSSQSSTDDSPPSPEIIPEVVPESYFDIRLVSADMIDQIRSHPGSDSILLKSDPGLPVGIASSGILYIRADFHEAILNNTNKNELTKDDISRHFIDIVFGRDNAKISRFKSDKDYKFFFTDQYTERDIDILLSYAKFFNNLSNIAKIEEEEVERSFLPGKYQTDPYYYYRITIVSPEMMKEYQDNKKITDILFKNKDGKVIGIVSPDRLILTNTLLPDEREYYLLKGLLWSMGFHGETTRYSDSFFTTGKNRVMNLSPLDREVVSLLYGGRLQNDMDVEAVEKALNLKTTKKKGVSPGSI